MDFGLGTPGALVRIEVQGTWRKGGGGREGARRGGGEVVGRGRGGVAGREEVWYNSRQGHWL